MADAGDVLGSAIAELGEDEHVQVARQEPGPRRRARRGRIEPEIESVLIYRGDCGGDQPFARADEVFRSGAIRVVKTPAAVPWPSFNTSSDVLSLPQPQIETGFASSQHCSCWAAG
jgi:hypothetical protein